MGALEGRVVIVTGAGRGLGREHALLFAREGAHVVVNDLGGATDGTGSDRGPAADVVAEIVAEGGSAIANYADVSDWNAARELVDTAIDQFGDLHVLVNNAGILRDRSIVNLDEDDWDTTIRVHLRGHIAPTRSAAQYWRTQSKAGADVDRALINTTSTSGLIGNFGQAAYGAAKAGIAALTVIAQIELESYGVRCNALAPAARTRLTVGSDGAAGAASPLYDGIVDDGHPGNVALVAAYLATASCPLRGLVLLAHGRRVQVLQPWTPMEPIESESVWSIDALRQRLDPLAGLRFTALSDLFPG
jgi:NAD(P)-dependent dehydrogenase (short-subunit alcohol dehydrogenase family)